MMLKISPERLIIEVQQDFNRHYPFLKIDFYKVSSTPDSLDKRQHLQTSVSIKKAGVLKDGSIEVNDSMTVGQLESILIKEFGLSAQVSRKSGILWLETTMTDSWTLKQQNDHGKELSEPIRNANVPKDRFLDGD